ncbi:antibiotic biosynthesis monooxygenase [Streptomyces sp. ISL-99]|uniref:antibiotic biosynthesis monooxygenase n=1 Tax=Streptomyces sp. ISL-99 TaxID=2819193 RepID=UPI001BE9FAC1|nr:antibiotic biosynthesis monooxygenase [Streptomyces sp. ISL-99]MBT2524934.1 antibiotic biosynthesis monooxygenase [Streptomyces sp. ISL-99]
MSVRGAQLDTRPLVGRSDAGAVLASTWRVGTPERQWAAVEAISKVWQSRPWPDVGLLSYSVYVGEDGDTLLHYSQWRSMEDYHAFVAAFRDERNAEIDAAVPGIERVALHAYEFYRSTSLAPGGADREPGCVVIVDVEFEGPDAARQRDWVDTVFEALATDPGPHPGGIAGHFHVSTDGTRVLNYAEWESAEAHIEALGGTGAVGAATPQWQKVHGYPGVTGGGVKRYTPALSLSAGV